MTPAGYRYGFRVLGPTTERRRLIGWAPAFRAYLECDGRAELGREAYLSAFTFGDDFRRHLEATGSPKGFAGPCWAPFVWFDLDAPDAVGFALEAARRLAGAITGRFKIADDALLVFYSGSKGFHVGVPTCFWGPAPGPLFHRIARAFAERIAAAVPVTIDTGIYDRVRIFRAPNSRHAKTGRYKRRLTFDELMGLSLDAITRLAEAPAPVEWEPPTGTSAEGAKLWGEAARQVEAEATARQQRGPVNSTAATLNRATLAFIREGAAVGDRHKRLYSAAANLAEYGCPPALAHALLTETALDCGLPPSDVRRAIDNGIASVGSAVVMTPGGEGGGHG